MRLPPRRLSDESPSLVMPQQHASPVRKSPNSTPEHGPSSDGLAPPFAKGLLTGSNGSTDTLPASYRHYDTRETRVANPAGNVPAFITSELSLGRLDGMDRHLWLAGARRPATQLHFHVALGRQITVVDRMDLHLLWDNSGRLFLKPIPPFLFDLDFWLKNLTCGDGEARPRERPPTPCRRCPRAVALGFLYTYVCLLASESDFYVANETRLLPRGASDKTITWQEWKRLAREILEAHNPSQVHPRFLRAELRLSRINNIHRFTRLPPFTPYLRGWNNYGSFFSDNLAWMAVATIFIALVLTAMQVGLATDRLQGDAAFQRASYGFTVFAILGPLCAFGLVLLGAVFNLLRDLLRIFQKTRRSGNPAIPV